ncbi:winged helix-turn-helix domain-containing protein [Yokenella regensburgei]|uniref:winged helix-turn-helix domain-containing protein n=1 Tax=Yokenella regensburgei TaxID=158877 RepID=UPI00143346C2|nr:winged helix-turn-helix domain-containing protein [Yokenella regensburgei]QIU92590.1 hypothetical protein HEC60_25120 [Yokenella regensburgei]
MVNISKGNGQQYSFDGFVLYPNGILVCNEKRIYLPPKEFGVLVFLLQSPGEIVSKNALLDDVWGGYNVSEESLTRCICVLRRVLSESSGDKSFRYIDTVYGKGYRFNRPVQASLLSPSEISRFLIAVLPPKSVKPEEPEELSNLHYLLVQELVKFTDFGISVVPVALTQRCQEVSDIIGLSQKILFDYYLTTQISTCNYGWKVSMEIFESKRYCLTISKTISFSSKSEIHSSLCKLLRCCIDGLSFSCTNKNIKGLHEVFN